MTPAIFSRSCWSVSSLVAMAGAITAALLAFFEPLGAMNIWVVLALTIGLGAWSVHRSLTSRDEVMSAATRSSIAIGAPAAIALSLVTAITAKYFAPLGDIITGLTETTPPGVSPGLAGFAYGVGFSLFAFGACVAIARSIWWRQKR